ncbi:MAG: hypothetical protein M5U19_06730 [Microthrixaceae bacterium]|nr:hypothetical protein [Microthrixaceae bacterium]
MARIAGLCSAALGSDELSGYCWTQLTDTYQERNGLLRADRTPKAELERIVTALWGVPPNPPDDAG